MIELFKASVPEAKKYFKFLKQIDKKKNYSNFGPIYKKFKYELSKHFDVQNENIELFSSCTGALVCALNSLKKKNKRYCILPSWTFVATVQAVIEAKMIPFFVDVSKDTMQVDLKSLKMVPKEILKKTSVFLGVAPFGMPFKNNLINKFLEKHKIDFLLDAAAGFEGAFNKNINLCISLHATKIFGIGEGGFYYSPLKSNIIKARSHSNFGFIHERKSFLAGVNYKISEYHCAVGLAALENWKSIRKKYFSISAIYKKLLKTKKISFIKGWGIKWISSTCIIKMKSSDERKKIINKFRLNNIPYKEWWNQGCHNEPYMRKFLKLKLNNSDNLASTTIGIPFHIFLRKKQIEKLFSILNSS